VIIRRMRDSDVEAAEDLSGLAFSDVPALPGDQAASPSRSTAAALRWCRRTRHLLATDPKGCWAAVDVSDGLLIGIATSLRREGLWGLSSLAVRPGSQDLGVGRALMERAAAYGAGALRFARPSGSAALPGVRPSHSSGYGLSRGR
jgi:GNAT superfamily N-acetyltransferase